MKERYKVFAITMCVTGLLWFGLYQFIGSTQGMAEALDIRDVPPMDPEAQAARLEARQAELEANPPVELRTSVQADPEPLDHDGEEEQLTVASVEGETEEEEKKDEDEDEDSESLDGEEDEVGRPERADSDADMVRRAESADGEAKVDIVGRDGELARLIAELDRELLAGAPPTRAVDVGLPPATVRNCPDAAGARFRTGVLFRHGAVGIKGRSLNRIDDVIRLWRACGGGEILVEPNPQGDVDGGSELRQRRRDEVKYYLLQRRVPAADIAFRERS